MNNVNMKAASSASSPESHRAKGIVIGIVIAVVIVIAAIVGFVLWGNAPQYDAAAQEGQASYKSVEEEEAELAREVEAGTFRIAIASVIDFEDGNSEGLAYIENVPNNHYNMQVTITDDASGDELYKSGVLKPNSWIEKIRLSKPLEKGTYSATATFTAINPETQDEVGKTKTQVAINVKN